MSARGFIDGIFGNELIGWVRDDSDLGRRFKVRAWLDGSDLGVLTATSPRGDLARAGVGDGRYGFRFRLEAPPSAGRHTVAARVEAERIVIPLAARPTVVERDRSRADVELVDESGTEPATGASEGTTVSGFVDGLVDHELIGWVRDDADLERRLRVRARFDGSDLGVVRAASPRGDLERAGVGDGRYGFRFTLEAPPSAGRHTVAAEVEADPVGIPLVERPTVLDEREQPRTDVELVDAHAEEQEDAPEDPEDASGRLAEVVVPERVLVGRAGWRFVATHDDHFTQLLGVDPITLRAIASAIEAVGAGAAAARDARAAFLAAVLPEKAFVYREHLPDGLLARLEGRPADLLAATFEGNDEFEVIDLALPMRHARRNGRLFTRTGGTLTWIGAFHAYRTVAKALATRLDALQPLGADALSLQRLIPVDDPLTGEIVQWQDGDFVPAPPDEPFAESEPGLADGFADVLPSDPDTLEQQDDTAVLNHPGAELSRVVIFHDEATRRIAQLLARHFERGVLAAKSTPDRELIRAEHPAAVIWLQPERALFRGSHGEALDLDAQDQAGRSSDRGTA